MKPQRTPRTASCLYMLGFLSGLAFIILCGSSAAYNGLRDTHSASKIAEAVAKESSPNDFLQSTTPPIGDIDVAILDETNEFDVQALGIEPGTQAVVRMEDNGHVLDTKTGIASEVGSIEVKFELPKETSSGNVDFVVSVGDTEKRHKYWIPPSDYVNNTPTQQPIQATDTPTLTPTPSPTILLPSPTLPSTATPIPTWTLTPSPTPVPVEPFYPNWRAEYYNNVTWGNEPVVIGDDQNIAFNWGESSPAPGAIGQNWFSARWTRRVVLPEGYYTFVLSADDQAEVYMNGQKLISYTGKTPAVNRVSRYVQGFEPIDFEVKYIEYWGKAHIQFYWEYEKQDCCWTVTYYNSPVISGEPLYSESIEGGDLRLSWENADADIWQHVGYGNPFSARITRELQAPERAGNYYLCVYAQDNVRLWLDRNQLITQCNCGERSCLICNRVYLGKNPLHQVNLEYVHTLGAPFLGVLTVPAKAGEPWIGAFFDNPDLAGPPVAVRTAPDIDFDWAQFAPPDTGLNYDYFSVRWQRTMELVYGQYQFHVIVDDGARLRVNGRTLIDQWAVGDARQFTATYDVWNSSEMAQIELDYYDNTIMAVLKLWWDAPPATPTPTPTMTPDP